MDKLDLIRLWAIFVLRMAFFAVALLWPAGTLSWWEAWVVIGLWTTFGLIGMIYLLRHDPALLMERLKFVPISKEQKSCGTRERLWQKRAVHFMCSARHGQEISNTFLREALRSRPCSFCAKQEAKSLCRLTRRRSAVAEQ